VENGCDDPNYVRNIAIIGLSFSILFIMITFITLCVACCCDDRSKLKNYQKLKQVEEVN